MHRTISIDYGFMICGQAIVRRSFRRVGPVAQSFPLQLVLPDGSRTLIKEGDVVVQRGTDHLWENASSTEWARESAFGLSVSTSQTDLSCSPGMAYVLLPSKPVVINGKELGVKSIH